MWYFIIIIVIFIILLIINDIEIKRDRENYNTWRFYLINQIGNPSKEIHETDDCPLKSDVYVFDILNKSMINESIYDYVDILDFSINNQMSYKTSTATGSMIGRGLVGGVLLGGVGAIVGASTGKKETTNSIVSYKIDINIRNINKPIESFKTTNESKAKELEGILKIIIDSNQNRFYRFQ